MVRVVHIFNVKGGVDADSFIEWLDGQLNDISRRFGCLGRRTWVFLDGINGNYEQGKPTTRPRYLNEALWPSQKESDEFRAWLMSEEGTPFRRRWFDGICNHQVHRYVDFTPRRVVGED